ncbi:MAG TPA: S9 family peptidase [Roseiarcus sp.]|nr:S9 family peptidase [Roseiarcus sp.]
MAQAKRGPAVDQPPKAERRPERRLAHGVEWIDDYAWLRAQNWREVLRAPAKLPAAIREHLEAENGYADRVLAPVKGLRRELVREMRARLKEDDSEAPQPDGPYAYYARYRHGGQHRIYCRTRRDGGKETILLDGDALAEGKTFFNLFYARHAPDHARIAWSCDDKGSELFTIRVREIASGADLPDQVENSTGLMVWTADSSAFLYVGVDESHRPCRVLLHRLGEAAGADKVIFEEADPAWFINVASTRLGKLAVISVHGHDASESLVVDLDRPEAPPRLIERRRSGVRYDVADHGDRFFIRTNRDGAADFKIVSAPREAPGAENWRDLVPHTPGRLIIAATPFANFLARLEREDGLPRIVVRDLTTDEEHVVAFDSEAYSLGFETAFEFDQPVMRFAFSSMTTPREIYDYDMTTRERVLRKRQMAPKGFAPSDYVTRRVFATAADGESVPISLFHRKDTPIDGSAPLLVYGYGAYGLALDAAFSTNRLSLVDRGFVFAIAHVRGGTDKGWRWYEDGKLGKKPNTFSDFIAATRHLIAENYASKSKVVAQGGSAGGMLMGAIANEAADLYRAIIADVPFVDVLNTMLDASLPLTPPEWLEWGNPIADRAAFDKIRSYSPYDNVEAQNYPAILAQAGLADPRVTYWEPAKWVAKLREVMTGGGPILLHVNMDAGHGGAAGRFDQLEDIALAYAFALAAIGGELAK